MTWKRRGHLLVAISILFAGALIRVHPIAGWMAFPERAQYDGVPVLTGFDAYYYLSLTRDLLEDRYEPIHRERRFPDSPPRPPVPPLLSQVTAAATKLTGAPLDWVAAFVPCALGLLVALPVYGLAWRLGGPLAGHTAAALCLFGPLYVARSSAGWFDTDPGNVAFLYAFSLFGLWLWRGDPLRRSCTAVLSAVALLLCLAWWDQAPYAVYAFWAIPALTAALLGLVSAPKPKAWVGPLATFLIGTLAWGVFCATLANVEGSRWEFVGKIARYVMKAAPEAYPNVSVSISEQQIPGWDKILWALGGDWPVVAVGAAGCLLLLVTRFREALFLAVPAGLLLLGCFKAYRFLVFAGPLIALGCGFAAAWAWGRATHRWVKGLVVLLCIGLFAQSASKIYEYQDDRWPVVHPKIVAGMERLQDLTPADAVIWNWADHGYPLLYWSRRATVADGATHWGTDMVWNAIPFAADNPRLSANYIRFFAARGRKGMAWLRRKTGGEEGAEVFLVKKLLAAPPEEARDLILNLADEKIRPKIRIGEWLEFLYPREAPPVYVFLDWEMARTAYWWYWFGTWNPREKKGVHPATRIFYRARKEDSIIRAEGFRADLGTGTAWLEKENEERPLGFARIITEAGREERSYERGGEYGILYYQPAALAFFLSRSVADSLFHRVFWEKAPEPLPGFRLVESNPPYYQVWEVIGDRWEADEGVRARPAAE
ncbi:STT3 domain-containing protein [Deferrisoma sp.]